MKSRPQTAGAPASAAGPPPVVPEAEVTAAALEVHGSLELADQLAILGRYATRWSGAPAALLLGVAGDGASLLALGGSGRASGLAPEGEPRLEAARASRILAAGPAPEAEAGRFPELQSLWPVPPEAIAALAARAPDGTLAGVLLLGFDRPAGAGAVDSALALLERARPALGHALRVRAMRELVIKDDTAHCYNRRYFESALPDELSRAGRFHTPLSLIFLDMDNLKEVNNRHGHAAGSRTLCEVAARVRSKIRRFDKLFRFGGDEFCIVLPETEWHGALEVAERVRDAIAREPFLADQPETGRCGVKMTASLGIASYPLHAHGQRELIEQADRAMQRIKNSTKNSIGIAEIVGGQHGR